MMKFEFSFWRRRVNAKNGDCGKLSSEFAGVKHILCIASWKP